MKMGLYEKIKALLNVPNPRETTLQNALLHNDIDKVRVLLKESGDSSVNLKDKYGRTPLFYAVSREMAELLVVSGADIDTKAPDGDTPLINACSYDLKDVAEFLISMGADINARNNDGLTSLHVTGDFGIAELLITKDADINARAMDGKTPLKWAEEDGNAKMAELIRAHGGK